MYRLSSKGRAPGLAFWLFWHYVRNLILLKKKNENFTTTVVVVTITVSNIYNIKRLNRKLVQPIHSLSLRNMNWNITYKNFIGEKVMPVVTSIWCRSTLISDLIQTTQQSFAFTHICFLPVKQDITYKFFNIAYSFILPVGW